MGKPRLRPVQPGLAGLESVRCYLRNMTGKSQCCSQHGEPIHCQNLGGVGISPRLADISESLPRNWSSVKYLSRTRPHKRATAPAWSATSVVAAYGELPYQRYLPPGLVWNFALPPRKTYFPPGFVTSHHHERYISHLDWCPTEWARRRH